MRLRLSLFRYLCYHHFILIVPVTPRIVKYVVEFHTFNVAIDFRSTRSVNT